MKRTSYALAAMLLWWQADAAASVTYRDVCIRSVPHVKQKPDFCGEACAESYLRKLGKKIDQDSVFQASGVDPVEGRGCRAPELVRALRRIGFKVGRVWESVDAFKSSVELEKLQFRANRKEDPTGYGTLKGVLGEKDMARFRKKWEAFVLELSFR